MCLICMQLFVSLEHFFQKHICSYFKDTPYISRSITASKFSKHLRTHTPQLIQKFDVNVMKFNKDVKFMTHQQQWQFNTVELHTDSVQLCSLTTNSTAFLFHSKHESIILCTYMLVMSFIDVFHLYFTPANLHCHFVSVQPSRARPGRTTGKGA